MSEGTTAWLEVAGLQNNLGDGPCERTMFSTWPSTEMTAMCVPGRIRRIAIHSIGRLDGVESEGKDQVRGKSRHREEDCEEAKGMPSHEALTG